MADDIQRVEEENASLREEIERVQEDRRAGFAEAEQLSRIASVSEENERLKKVLADQRDILEREKALRGEIGSDKPATNAEGLAPETPYTYTPEGPITSDEEATDDDERDDVTVYNEEN